MAEDDKNLQNGTDEEPKDGQDAVVNDGQDGTTDTDTEITETDTDTGEGSPQSGTTYLDAINEIDKNTAERIQKIIDEPEVDPYQTDTFRDQQKYFDNGVQVYDNTIQGAEDDLQGKKEDDDEQTRSARRSAFWTGIGEIGSAIVNQIGTSGAFAGKNAYGRGAYSSMMKFNLTAKALSDKAKADHDRRVEYINGLKDKLDNLKAQRDMYKVNADKSLGDLAQGIRDKQEADKAARIKGIQDAADKQKDFLIKVGKLQTDETKAAAAIAKSLGGGSKGGGSGSGRDKQATTVQFDAFERDKDGKKVYDKDDNGNEVGAPRRYRESISGPASLIEDGIAKSSLTIANEMASHVGGTTYNKFAYDLARAVNDKGESLGSPSDHKISDNQYDSAYIEDVMKALKLKETRGMTGSDARILVNALLGYYDIDTKSAGVTSERVEQGADTKITDFNYPYKQNHYQWAAKYWDKFEASGRYVQRYVNSHKKESGGNGGGTGKSTENTGNKGSTINAAGGNWTFPD